jgi:hypothetical protein
MFVYFQTMNLIVLKVLSSRLHELCIYIFIFSDVIKIEIRRIILHKIRRSVSVWLDMPNDVLSNCKEIPDNFITYLYTLKRL